MGIILLNIARGCSILIPPSERALAHKNVSTNPFVAYVFNPEGILALKKRPPKNLKNRSPT